MRTSKNPHQLNYPDTCTCDYRVSFSFYDGGTVRTFVQVILLTCPLDTILTGSSDSPLTLALLISSLLNHSYLHIKCYNFSYLKKKTSYIDIVSFKILPHFLISHLLQSSSKELRRLQELRTLIFHLSFPIEPGSCWDLLLHFTKPTTVKLTVISMLVDSIIKSYFSSYFTMFISSTLELYQWNEGEK